METDYDRALKKEITQEEAELMIAVGDNYVESYERLYNSDTDQDTYNLLIMENPQLLYNLYTQNCDTVAKEILFEIEPRMTNLYAVRPNINYNIFLSLADTFGWQEVMLDKNFGFGGIGKSIINQGVEKFKAGKCEVE